MRPDVPLRPGREAGRRPKSAGLPWTIAFAAAWLLGPPPSAALEADATQPIEIQADAMRLDQARGVTEYRGQVRLTQGSIEVGAERLTLHTDNGRLVRMEIVGSADQPATFRQQTQSGALARGQARRIEYNADNSRLVLQGRAELQQGPNHIRSERIDYNTRTNNLMAGDDTPPDTDEGSGNDRRVEITIQSGQKQDQKQE